MESSQSSILRDFLPLRQFDGGQGAEIGGEWGKIHVIYAKKIDVIRIYEVYDIFAVKHKINVVKKIN